jgi:hypothetical protein
MVIYHWHDFKQIATWFRLLWLLSFPIIVWFSLQSAILVSLGTSGEALDDDPEGGDD